MNIEISSPFRLYCQYFNCTLSNSFQRVIGIVVILSTSSCLSIPTSAPEPSRFLLTEINIVDVRTGDILENYDLLIMNGKIAGLRPHSRINVTPETITICQKGRYVIPGLIDMHAHLSAVDDAPRMLSYGITGARHMADVPWWTRILMGFPSGRTLREKIKTGELQGPDLFIAGLTLDGKPPISPLNQVITEPTEARKVVREQVAAGYDYIKVYDRLSIPVFEAVIEEAARNNIPVIGHVPVAVGIDRAFDSSLASIEHLTGYIDQHHVKFLIDEHRLKEYAERTKAMKMINCPTLVIWRNIPQRDGFKALERQPEYRHLSWRVKWLWKTTLGYLDKKPYQGKDLAGDMTRLTVAMTRALYEAGAPIVAGTDMNFLGVYPGISLHLEMEYLRDAGLSDLDALRAATINAAEALGLAGSIGSIEAGKRANLVILDENPLTNIRATQTIHDVIKDGKRIPKCDKTQANRRPEPARGTSGDGNLEEGMGRD